MLFRSRYAAEQRLRRLCAGLLHAESIAPICTMLVVEPAEALDLASCALFLREESGAFAAAVRRLGRPEPSPHSADDPMILELKGDLQPLWLRDVHDDLFDGFDPDKKPALALAIQTRGRLRGVLFAGAHASPKSSTRPKSRCFATSSRAPATRWIT